MMQAITQRAYTPLFTAAIILDTGLRGGLQRKQPVVACRCQSLDL